MEHLTISPYQKQKTELTQSFALESNADTSVKTGTRVTYSVLAHGNNEGLNDFGYRWNIMDASGTLLESINSNKPQITLAARFPGTYRIQAEVLSNGETIEQVGIQQNVYFEKRNTVLGGLIVGNFDFRFDGYTAVIDVRVKFSFQKGISPSEQLRFKEKFFKAIHEKWTNNGVSFTTKGACTVKRIPLKIEVAENEKDYNKLVTVTKKYRRPKVVRAIQLYKDITENTIAHEFGHVIGLYDEYDGGWIENIMFWHDDGSHHGDKSALMNLGTELRRRYFTPFLKIINELTPPDCIYNLDAPFQK